MFAVHAFDTAATLKKKKKSQGHQTWYKLAGLKQGYNNATYKRLRIYSVWEYANVNVLSNRETCQLSPLNTSEM